ncbi:MAG: beta-propeller fold lactonase family protein, partial [Deltaproteobacteria bacterium]|nr:beta-propeller fold lactonase family protein [Deltaproteobacteria bacterium]
MLVVLAASCSLETPKPGKVRIVIDDRLNKDKVAQGLFDEIGASFGILSGPSSTSDFNCFAVNVTGVNIDANNRFASGCSSADNMHGRGSGLVSSAAARGATIELDLTAGIDRGIDVYGFFPTPTMCGGPATGNFTGYFLGGVTQSIVQNATITVPITFSSTTPQDLTCVGSGTTPNFNYFIYVANQGSNDVSAYTINTSTGALAAVSGSPFTAGTNPFSVAVDPLGKFAYAVNGTTHDVSAYTINS